MYVFVHAQSIKTVHASTQGRGVKNGKILSTQLLNAPLLMYIMNFFLSFFTVVKVSYFLVKMSLLKQAFQLISVFPLLKLIAKFVFQIQPLSSICLIKPRITKVRCRHSLNSTMVSVSTVQHSLKQEFLCTQKNFKMSLYTLNEKPQKNDLFHMKSNS